MTSLKRRLLVVIAILVGASLLGPGWQETIVVTPGAYATIWLAYRSYRTSQLDDTDREIEWVAPAAVLTLTAGYLVGYLVADWLALTTTTTISTIGRTLVGILLVLVPPLSILAIREMELLSWADGLVDRGSQSGQSVEYRPHQRDEESTATPPESPRSTPSDQVTTSLSGKSGSGGESETVPLDWIRENWRRESVPDDVDAWRVIQRERFDGLVVVDDDEIFVSDGQLVVGTDLPETVRRGEAPDVVYQAPSSGQALLLAMRVQSLTPGNSATTPVEPLPKAVEQRRRDGFKGYIEVNTTLDGDQRFVLLWGEQVGWFDLTASSSAKEGVEVREELLESVSEYAVTAVDAETVPPSDLPGIDTPGDEHGTGPATDDEGHQRSRESPAAEKETPRLDESAESTRARADDGDGLDGDEDSNEKVRIDPPDWDEIDGPGVPFGGSDDSDAHD